MRQESATGARGDKVRIETVTEYDGGDCPAVYLSRGHVNKQDFVDAVKKQCEEVIPVEKVKHGYMRNVPTGIKGEWILHDAVKGRGAFAVTFIDFFAP